MIQNEHANSGLSLAANIMLSAFDAVDNAGRCLKYWDNAEIFKDKKALKKRPQVEALLEEIRGQYQLYFPVDILILDAHKVVQEICLALLEARDIYKSIDAHAAKFAGSPTLAPLRSGVNYADRMETDILNASLTYGCYKAGDAMYMAGNVEKAALFLDGEPLPDTEREQVEAIRVRAAAALEPVREKYGLIFPVAHNPAEADALTDKYDMGFSATLKRIWKTSGIDII